MTGCVMTGWVMVVPRPVRWPPRRLLDCTKVTTCAIWHRLIVRERALWVARERERESDCARVLQVNSEREGLCVSIVGRYRE